MIFVKTIRRIVREEIERRLGPPHADLLSVGEKDEIIDGLVDRMRGEQDRESGKRGESQ